MSTGRGAGRQPSRVVLDGATASGFGMLAGESVRRGTAPDRSRAPRQPIGVVGHHVTTPGP
jgi:hypothetical protein